MTTTPYQPHLPAEIRFTDAELTFLDESPPGLFPENQDSNFGFMIRKVFSDLAQNIINWQTTLYNEHFASTASQFLDQWEIDVGLPPNPAGISIAQQRQVVLARLQRGPFTRPRRNAVIENYIAATFGNPIQLVPAGTAFSGTGIPIYGETVNPSTLYRVYEDKSHFSYEVRITNTTTPDMNSLTRELKRITPAGISFTLNNTLAGTAMLSLSKEILSDQPIFYLKMDNSAVDSSGFGNNATVVGGVVAGASLVPNVPGALNAFAFNGSTGYLLEPAQISFGSEVTIEFWLRMVALPAAGNSAFLWYPPGVGYVYVNENGSLVWVGNPTTSPFVASRNPLSLATTYHVAVQARSNGETRFVVNGVVFPSTVYNGPFSLGSAPTGFYIGSAVSAGTFLNGTLDEYAIFNRYLSLDRIVQHYRTGMNLL